jgi:hypothetical protein
MDVAVTDDLYTLLVSSILLPPCEGTRKPLVETPRELTQEEVDAEIDRFLAEHPSKKEDR